MKAIPALMIALCLLLAPICRAEDDVAKARKELQAAVDAAVKQHPELDDVAAYFSSRTKGSNGGDEFFELSKRCAAIFEDGGDSLLFFRFIHDPSPSAYGEEELILLRSGLETTKPIADAAEKLLEFDCLVPDANIMFALTGDSGRFIKLIDLPRLLTSRAVAMAAVGAETDKAVEALMLSYRLATKIELSMHLLGSMVTEGIRDGALSVALQVAETLDKPEAILAQLKDVRASRNFGPRDRWFGELAFVVAVCRNHLALNDEALQKESNEHPDYKGKSAKMLTGGARYVELAAAVLAAFPTSDRVSAPEPTSTLVKALDAAKSEKYAREDYVFGNVRSILYRLIAMDLTADARRLQFELRLYEARRGSWPDQEATSTLLKEFPGLSIRRVDDGVVIDAASDHPVRRLTDEKLLTLPLELKPWAK